MNMQPLHLSDRSPEFHRIVNSWKSKSETILRVVDKHSLVSCLVDVLITQPRILEDIAVIIPNQIHKSEVVRHLQSLGFKEVSQGQAQIALKYQPTKSSTCFCKACVSQTAFYDFYNSNMFGKRLLDAYIESSYEMTMRPPLNIDIQQLLLEEPKANQRFLDFKAIKEGQLRYRPYLDYNLLHSLVLDNCNLSESKLSIQQFIEDLQTANNVISEYYQEYRNFLLAKLRQDIESIAMQYAQTDRRQIFQSDFAKVNAIVENCLATNTDAKTMIQKLTKATPRLISSTIETYFKRVNKHSQSSKIANIYSSVDNTKQSYTAITGMHLEEFKMPLNMEALRLYLIEMEILWKNRLAMLRQNAVELWVELLAEKSGVTGLFLKQLAMERVELDWVEITNTTLNSLLRSVTLAPGYNFETARDSACMPTPQHSIKIMFIDKPTDLVEGKIFKFVELNEEAEQSMGQPNEYQYTIGEGGTYRLPNDLDYVPCVKTNYSQVLANAKYLAALLIQTHCSMKIFEAKTGIAICTLNKRFEDKLTTELITKGYKVQNMERDIEELLIEVFIEEDRPIYIYTHAGLLNWADLTTIGYQSRVVEALKRHDVRFINFPLDGNSSLPYLINDTKQSMPYGHFGKMEP